jgi:UDP-N-acetyl-alpha-D-quinovosamine dehydrogenase
VARVVVTGAAGFIGRALCGGLVERGHRVLGLTRGSAEPISGVEIRPIGEITAQTPWPEHLGSADIVIHLANRAHRPVAAEAASREAEAAAMLARAAAANGVRRLVYMSSVRAMGETTRPGAPFRPTDPPLPREAYGRAKLATEQALATAAQETGRELVILRPPLVYGPAVKANFRALIRLAASGLPLPFAGIANRRSLIFLENLVDAAVCAAIHPAAAGHVLLARDAADLSTEELIRKLAEGLGRPTRLFAIPQAVLAACCRLPALGTFFARLTLSLQVDDSATRHLLGWAPPVSPEIGLAATARAFLEER